MIKFSKRSARIQAARVLLLIVVATSAACVSNDPWAPYGNVDPEGNIFVQGYGNQRPRYGHGGTESPSARKAREQQEKRSAAREERYRRESARQKKEDAEITRRQEQSRENQRPQEITPPDSLADDRPELMDDIEESDPLPQVEADPTPPPPPAPTPTQETLAYGRPVPGKPGMVYSPYSPDAGYVDVRGIAPGTKVKCPYTKKLFRVP